MLHDDAPRGDADTLGMKMEHRGSAQRLLRHRIETPLVDHSGPGTDDDRDSQGEVLCTEGQGSKASALFDHARSNPPHQWMEPEHRFHDHVHRSEQIVAAAHMAQFVRQHRLQLRLRQPFRNPLRHKQNRPQEADDSRL